MLAKKTPQARVFCEFNSPHPHPQTNPPTPTPTPPPHTHTLVPLIIEPTLVQIMACRLFSPSHYLNQCWVFVDWTLGNKLQWKFNHNIKLLIHENASEHIACEMAILFRERHDDVIKWKHFPRNWPFVRGNHRSLGFPTQRPVTRSFDVFFHLRLNRRLSKQPWGWWFETL